FFILSYSQCTGYELLINSNNPTCHNYSDGAINLATIGGNGGDYFVIKDSGGTVISSGFSSMNNLTGGWYFCEVSDDSSCFALDSVYLVNPPEIQAQIIHTNPTHLDSCNGVAEVDTVLFYQGNFSNIAYFWNPGGPSGIGETIKDDLCNDFYSLTISDELGCNVVINFAVGSAFISDTEHQDLFTLFPNPSRDKQYLNFTSDEVRSIIIDIVDINGRVVKQILDGHSTVGSNTIEIDIRNLPPGIYAIRISFGSRTYSVKTVKVH
ncbi:MAG: T9SS type A sorting domain-containing protein, partial [Crocinitomicaceae bacterium]|nr:T9SS type A sorting domain-containing protein [Crocinitomicaceae bacterium]